MSGLEAAGFAISVIGLVPLCAQGFEFIEGMVKAKVGLEERWLEITMQYGLITRWANIWGVPTVTNKTDTPERLRLYFENNINMRTFVLLALAQISDKLANTTDLEKKYGIHIPGRVKELGDFNAGDILAGKHPQQLQYMLIARRERMSLIKRSYTNARFVLRDEKKFEAFIRSLDSYIDKLWKMCSELEAQQIQRSIVARAAGTTNATESKRLADAATKLAERQRLENKKAGGYEWLSEVLNFKTRLQNFRLQEPIWLITDDWTLDVEQWRFGDRQQYGLAKHKKSNTLSYIEWRFCWDPTTGEPNQDLENNILELARFATIRGRPRNLATLRCEGVMKDTAKIRYGFVYEMPSGLATMVPSLANPDNAAILSARRPAFPSELIASQPILDLDQRFRIARKLAQSLFVLHASGWVHKNLRTSSIVFPPSVSATRALSGSRSASRHMKQADTSDPRLWDFGFSRPQSSTARPTAQPGIVAVTVVASDIILDHHQHPAKRLFPMLRYTQAFDIYSLGTVLLELGFWQPLSSFEPDRLNSAPPELFQARLIGLAGRELRGQVGRIYADVVRECLNMNRNTTDEAAQEVLCWKVASALDRCAA